MALGAEVHERAFSLFETLLRIDTTNPPGGELPAAEALADFLRDGGLEPQVLESAPGRGNIVARLKGRGDGAPLLIATHLDVVPSEDGTWDHPPFSATIEDGWIWGRGAVDMKNMAAMGAAIVRQLAEEGAQLERDLIFVGVADEETGCTYGSIWLSENHPELVRAEYALGEVGGFPIYMMGRTFYPVQVAEKGIAWLRATAHGEAGHGALPRDDSGLVRLADAISRMARTRLPQHTVAATEDYVRSLARGLPFPASMVFPWLLSPWRSNFVLNRLVKDDGVRRALAAALSNTASPTVARAGSKTNVIPGEATLEIDGRTLPGQTAADLVRELSVLCGPHLTFEVMREEPPLETPKDTPLYRIICDAIVRADPDGIPIPYLLPGYTDFKGFDRLGVKWYGCSPVRLPEGPVRFGDLYHRPNERIPVDGFHWGLDVLDDIVRTHCGA